MMPRVPGDGAVSRAANAALLQLGCALTRARWSIAIYSGDDPLRLAPAPGADCPALTRHDVTDTVASFVADPFMIKVDGTWHMFFEILEIRPPRKVGVIGHATSPDALRWTYQSVVLRTETHLSYPQVFEAGGEIYMLPEMHAAGRVLLYRADPFPSRWVVAAELLPEPLYDCTMFERDGGWWMFAEARVQSDTLRLFHAPAPTGPWREHPRSPVVRGDPRRSRPAGRVLATPDRLIRFAQDGVPRYGTAVRALEITTLTATDYAEREIGTEPILGPGHDWNRRGMHQLDVHRDGSGWVACVDGLEGTGDRWIACVDGWYRGAIGLAEIRRRVQAR